MCNEITYARDTSVSIPRVSPFFRIFKACTDGDKKGRLLTPSEFKVILGKRAERKKVSIEEFRQAIDDYLAK